MTSSNLTETFIYSPNRYSPRAYPITKVTVHHMAGDLSIEACGSVFASSARQASSNYGVDSYGRIGCYVPEEDAAWTSANWENDNRAITIEVADEDCTNWVPSQAAYDSTVALCADICTRYGIEPRYTGDASGTFTEHMMFAATGCPGPWWHAHMGEFVQDVKRAMEGEYMALTNEELEQIAQRVWGYNYASTARGGANVYDQACGTYDYAKRAAEAATAAQKAAEKATVGAIDYDKLGNVVADKLAARLKS